MNKIQELTNAYIKAIRYHGPTAIANAKADLLMEVTNVSQDQQQRDAILRRIERQLKQEFSKD